MKTADQYLLKDSFYKLLKNRSNAKQFIENLSCCGELLLFGGGVRGFFENEYQPNLTTSIPDSSSMLMDKGSL